MLVALADVSVVAASILVARTRFMTKAGAGYVADRGAVLVL